ncbi:MAG: AN1-type zinc finger domain-containing protein [Candidatus Heimdallarchaeaceae archaeon]
MKSCSLDGCMERDSLPFKCKLCGQMYCAKHRLPEQHNCIQIGIYQTDEYKKAKVSAPRPEKKDKVKIKRYGESIYGPRDSERKSIQLESQDRFMMRSSFFTLFDLKSDFINILVASLLFSLFLGTHSIVTRSVYQGIQLTPLYLYTTLLNFGITVFIFSGFYAVQKMVAKRMKLRSGVTLWLQGILLGLFSIFVPIFVVPAFLVFRDFSGGDRERGIAALSGIIWMLFWSIVCLVFMFANGFGVVWLYALKDIPMFLLLFSFFTLLPFGIFTGRYIARWNRKISWSLLAFTFTLFIVYLVKSSRMVPIY